ncbi:hypothetical protein [Spirilliplanes yamanashiensis]|uniref:Uncharacterized protein n=1 Tax=Spirilliplanes yamanashiensis TaxID=42233 RepID=A0A8J3Y6K0_9ACTN|nr:hypothetical protein [Spirilliplanes yamanashiensis]MDP9814825.1 hypothetical protein [Spirilliplanes yamanashiensis]GIJ02480.1 hypothetical protein Sya03_18320 [Spirilliplanes yamanashiensis]
MALSRSPRVYALLGAGVLTLGGLAAVAVLLWPQADAPATPAAPAAPADAVVVRTTADPGEPERLAAVTALVAQLPAQFAAADTSALTASAREQFGDVRRALPAGTTLAVDPASWHRTGAVASITVTATRPGQPGVRFRLVTVQEGGAWRVLSTTPIDEAR